MSDKVKFTFPECWEDDERMNALFSPFRAKYINPEYYSKKLEFWQSLIYNYCKSNEGCPAFRKEDLECGLKRNDQIPRCFDTIIEEMIHQKLIKEQSEFFSETTSSWTSWILSKLIKNPLKWGYYKILPNNNRGTYQYIHCELLKHLSSDLLSILQKYCGEVLTLDEVRRKIQNEIYLNELGLKICLYYLSVQKAIYLDLEIHENNLNIKLIKIPSKNNPLDKLTEIDRNLQQLKETSKYITQEIENLELEITNSNNLARKHIKVNRKLAEVYLRKKQFLQKRLGKKGDILFNIETLIGHIEDARQNGIVLSIFQLGSETLQFLNSKLNLENVNEIISTMEDVTNNHTEIQNEIANFDNSDVNDMDLQKELEELLSENESDQTLHQKEFDIKSESEHTEKTNVENMVDQLNSLKIESSTLSSTNRVIKD